MAQEVTNEDGWSYRVGGDVNYQPDAPSGDSGKVRKLYRKNGEWWAVVAWPHWRPLCRRIGWLFKNHHPLSDLVGEPPVHVIEHAPDSRLHDIVNDHTFIVGDEVTGAGKSVTGIVTGLYTENGTPTADVAWPIPGLNVSVIDDHPLSELAPQTWD